MTHAALSAIELCAGVGMLGEGVRTAFEHLGFGYRTVAYVEREAPAAAQLVALMEAGVLDAAPVWSDLLTFRGRDWFGKVDLIAAGFPCQGAPVEPLDTAGAQRLRLNGAFDGLFHRTDVFVRRVGKKAAGRLLDGVTHDAFPEVR